MRQAQTLMMMIMTKRRRILGLMKLQPVKVICHLRQQGILNSSANASSPVIEKFGRISD